MRLTKDEKIASIHDREQLKAELSAPDLSDFPEYEHHMPEGWAWLWEFIALGLIISGVVTVIVKFHIHLGGK